jgi:hypothetical protein
MLSMPGFGSSGPLRDYYSYGQEVWWHAGLSRDTRCTVPARTVRPPRKTPSLGACRGGPPLWICDHPPASRN